MKEGVRDLGRSFQATGQDVQRQGRNKEAEGVLVRSTKAVGGPLQRLPSGWEERPKS